MRIGLYFTYLTECEEGTEAGWPEHITSNCPVMLLSRITFYPLAIEMFKSAKRVPESLSINWEYTARVDICESQVLELDILITDTPEFALRMERCGKPVHLVIPFKWFPQGEYNFPRVTIFRQMQSETIAAPFQRLLTWCSFFGKSSFEPVNKTIRLDVEGGKAVIVNLKASKPDDLESIFNVSHTNFTHISIETTSVCNLKCSYCPNSAYLRDKEFMPSAMYYKIIDSICVFDPAFDGMISLNLYGEPLLDERLEDFVRYAKYWLPESKIHINTNGMFLTTERYINLIKAGVGWFCITQHTKEPSPVISETLTAVTRDYPEIAFFNYQVGVGEYFNRGGLLDVPMKPVSAASFERCNAYRDLVINVKGDVVLCCNDYFGKHKFGNILTSSIYDIWHSKEYCKVRNQLLLGFLALPICRKCVPLSFDSELQQCTLN